MRHAPTRKYIIFYAHLHNILHMPDFRSDYVHNRSCKMTYYVSALNQNNDLL